MRNPSWLNVSKVGFQAWLGTKVGISEQSLVFQVENQQKYPFLKDIHWYSIV